uniref:Cytochrome c oxidase subunit 2 n=1 Tax=Monodontina vondembuschiana TaxID=2508272 RepID=A0A513X0G1_9BIVA|nr:cytochrome c oxidase subunit 2 [Monodontina vondembuschiana]
MSFWGQLGLQEGCSVLGVEIQCLYDHGMFIVVLVFGIVSVLLFKILGGKSISRVYLDSQLLEVVWTVLPFWVLLALGLPSIKLLYLMDEVSLPEVTVKITGRQWYWTYEYSDVRGSSYKFDSYMIHDNFMVEGYRLLEVDNRCVMPTLLPMRGLVTSGDVIHSWAIPAGAVKVDGVPGRINQVSLCFTRPGVFYGQCSELCGVNHSFMPVCVESVPVGIYTRWIIYNHDSVLSSMGSAAGSWTWWGLLFGVMKAIGKGIYWASTMYAMYLYYLFYYSFYVPAKFIVVKGCGLASWLFSSSLAFAEWCIWFSDSPGEAFLFALGWVGKGVLSAVVFVVASPVKAVCWGIKLVYTCVFGIGSLCHSVFEAVVHSMSSFAGDEFHEHVMREVNWNTKKLIWILMNRYSKG